MSLPKLSDPGILIKSYFRKSGTNIPEGEFSEQVIAEILSNFATELHLIKSSTEDNRWYKNDPPTTLQYIRLDAGLNFFLEYIVSVRNGAEDWLKETNYFIDGLNEFMQKDNSIKLVGRTIIYQAVIPNDFVLHSLSGQSLMSAFGTTNISSDKAHDIPGGRMWLTYVPVFQKDWESKNVYLALCHKDDEQDQSLYFFKTIFTLPDLITHRANEIAANYYFLLENEHLDALIKDIKSNTEKVLCNEITSTNLVSNVLHELASNFNRLLGISLNLIAYANSLAQQKKNYISILRGDEEYKNQSSPIWQLYAERIDNTLSAVEMQRDQCRRLLETANLAVNIAQTRLDKISENRRRRQEILLTFLGVAFALPQLFTFETIVNIMSQFSKTTKPLGILLIQIGLILIISLLILLILRLSERGNFKKNQ
jgi:hypothetical protein